MRTRPRTAEVLVLVAGVLSAVGLGWAALRPWGDPEVSARVERERGTRRAAQLMRLAWEQHASDPQPPTGERAVEARRRDRSVPDRLAAVDRERPPAGVHPFDALLADAEQTRDRAALERALADHPDAARRPEGWLRLIQLSVDEQDHPAARAAWRSARAELSPQDARRDVAYLLLITLAAAPALDEEERGSAQAELTAEWTAGTLAVPNPRDHWEAGDCRFDPRYDLLTQALAELSPRHADAVPALRDHDGRRLRALLTFLGDPPLPDGASGRWEGLADTDWLVRTDGERVRLCAAVPEALARIVQAEARAGEAYLLVGKGEKTGQVVEVAGRAWPILHVGFDEMVTAERGRQRLLRLGFGALLVLSAGSFALTYAALVRRRRLEDLKSRFVAGVSHDLRTPLASILLMAENLESGRVVDPERQAQYHTTIRREATRLRRLVDDVLDFSRLERGETINLAVEPIELSGWADQVAGETLERCERAGIRLAVERSGLAGSASFDAEALRRAVGNLVDNALTHSGSETLELVLRLDGEALVIEVADEGCGLGLARPEDLFAPFAQGDSVDGAQGGSGLGLAIVRELSRAHGGDAVFVPQPVGTRIRLTLPAKPTT